MSDVRLSRKEHVAILEIARGPDNFVDKAIVGELAEALETCSKDAEIRCVLLCSEGKNFCAGVNFAEAAAFDNIRGDHIYNQAVRLFRCDTPIVAAVQGSAVGAGLGLAMVADFRVTAPESRFVASFNRLGFHPGFGLSVTLPRAIGPQQTALMLYTGGRLTGQQAHEVGLADLLAPQETLRQAALDLATEIARSAPLAVTSTRRTLRRGLADAVATAVEHELAEQAGQVTTEDFREGVRAMQERRPPVFKGR